MWKAILAGTTALAIAGSSLVYAQQRGDRPGGMQRGPNIEDMNAFADARLAGLKAGLALTPEQERNWPAFEQATRDMQKLRLDRINAFMAERRNPNQPPPSADPVERMRRQGTAMADTGAALKKLADATEPLLKSLDDNQKRRFAMLGRMGEGGRDGRDFRGRDDGGRDFRGRDGGGRQVRGERENDGREVRRGREDGDREFRGGDREFRGGREFRGRDGGDREFRGRDGDRQRGFDRDPRRTENAPEGFERGWRGPGRMFGGPRGAEQDHL